MQIQERIEDSYQLSPMQQGMLFHSLYAKESGVDIEQMLFALHEDLNVSAFKRAWQRVISRHPVLRTSFHWQGDNEPSQYVHQQVRLVLDEQDWCGLSAQEQKERLMAYLQVDRQHGFDLTEAPLMRLALFQVGEFDYQLLWTFHHIILDGRSFPIVLKEVFAFYDALCQGQDLQLEQPSYYRDYIQWHQQQDSSKAEGFFKQLLKDFTAPTPVVVQAPAADNDQENSGVGEQEIRLSVASTSALQSLAQQHGLTLNTLVQGAWALLLSRYSGEADVVFGATRACRHSSVAGAESMVGLLINTLPVRVGVSPEMPLLPWLKELRAQWIALRDYEHTPLSEIQGWSDISGGTSLFDSIVVFENCQLDSMLRSMGGRWENIEVRLVEQTNYPLTLLGYAEPELLLKLKYDRRRFDDATIARLLGHVKTLLSSMAANPFSGLAELPLLTVDERHQLLVSWNDTSAEYSQDACIHQLFEAQVERNPNAIAVVFENQQLTYQELNCQANKLAHHLKSVGVGPGKFVGVYMDRSLEMIPAVLGILKAGGAYVPLETSFPKARIEWILCSIGVSTVVTQQSHLQTFDELQPQLPALEHLICLDAGTVDETNNTQVSQMSASSVQIWRRSHLCLQQQSNLPLQSSPDDTAYIIFTSGSTGTPKGVVVRHKPVINLIEWVNKTFNVNASDRVLFITSLCFDLSVYDIFGLLAAGGSIRVVSSQDMRDPRALLSILCNEPITFWDSAPPALQQLVPFFPDASSGQQNSLRLVFMSGDWIPVTLPDLVEAAFPGVEVISLGGATEATVWSNFYRIGEVDPTWVNIPYGKPIQNAQYYILDAQGNPCPIGVSGELYIGGECLASGYTDPVKTAERFIPNPFSQVPDARLYRTGDLARFLPDGNIQFLGRIDHQVKIRGFRIELGEIEAILSQHPAVRESVVLAREDEPGNKRLVAYIALEQGESLTASQVRSFVKEKLPEYMVPSAFVFLEALPITANGKLDRRALPAPNNVKQSSEMMSLSPQTPVEEVLALIWAQVLKLQQVDVQDNFFELGGHSLLATQLMSRIREAFQVELAVRQLFELPTVAGLAQRVETAQREQQGLQVPPIQPTTHGKPVLASFAQQRLWVLEQLISGNAAYNIPVVLRVLGPLNVAALEQSFNEICKRHATLRTTFSTTAGQPIQVISPPHPLPLPVTDLRDIPAVERESTALQLAREAAQQPFDLVQGPLLRTEVLRLSEENNLLVLTMHHIISDGWSIGVLVRELAALYEAFSKGQPSPLPQLPIQYTDFAHWQQQWLQGDVLQLQLDYWKQRLSGNLAPLELPTDRPRPPVQTFQGARQTLVLPQPLTQSLKRLSRERGVTLFMTLLPAFQTLLCRYTGQEDILVGSPIANRNSVEIEGLIGFFVNTLVMRTNLSGNPTFEELLAQVREVALGAYAHQDVPFEKLVEQLQPERDLSRSPLFQVMFILQNAPMPALELADVTVSPLDIDNGISKFDLTLSMEDSQQGLVGIWEYNTDLFDSTTITRMAGHFQTLLEGIVAHPEQRVSHLPLLSADERHQLLVSWNETKAEYPHDVCVHQLFEATVERSPNKVAVVFGNQQLTYSELNQQANQLASYLKKCGVGTEAFVGICVERSLLMVVGLLAILKAGGTYVPIDPKYPADRVAFVLEDTTAPVLLTQASLVANLPINSARVVCLDTDWEIIAQEDKENSPGEVTPDNLAYVIYTSGSTGKPKGVQILHRAVVNFLTSMSLTPGLTVRDILLSVTTISFDISVLEIFLPLTVGASLVVASPEDVRDVYALQELLLNSGATVMQATPATWRLLLEAGWRGKADLKILCGGEAMPRALASQLRERVGSLWNMYGPTETTIWSTVHQVEEESELISIGRPIANTQIYLLDSYGQPVPIGVPGELHIGGIGLARGYLNRTELTAEKFIYHPYSDQPGARLYKTGDLARYLPNGNIEHLGRIDHQVKIRGFRIELGEIEAVLGLHPDVRQTVVMGREDLPGDKHLVAYIVPHQEQAYTTIELRSFLKEKLPEYMVPSRFVILEALPLTPNGKVDRRALPKPELSKPELEENFVAPHDTLELLLTKIWEEVLDTQPVAVRDNFFDLGGHSLLAVRLLAQIKNTFGQNLPLATLFLAPTIEQLANILRPSEHSATWDSLVPIKSGDANQPPLFLVHDADGETILYLNLARYLESQRPVYGLRPYSKQGYPLLHTRIQEMVTHYIEQIRTVQAEGPYLLSGLCAGGVLAFEIAQQLQAQGQQVALVALIDAADVQVAKRIGRVSAQRLQRFTSLLSPEQQSTGQHRLTSTLNKALEKVKNLLAYELGTKLEHVRDRFKLMIYRYYLDKRLPLPQFVQNITLRTVYKFAAQEYVPQVYQGQLTLFRASDGVDADEPLANMTNDPLFGWGKRATEGVKVYDIPGGHSSMLQEPFVQVLAEHLKAEIIAALAK